MSTKQKVQALAKKQGADFAVGYDSRGNFYAEVYLPEPLIWKNGYGTGACVQTREPGESMGDFWDAMIDYIDHPVINPDDTTEQRSNTMTIYMAVNTQSGSRKSTREVWVNANANRPIFYRDKDQCQRDCDYWNEVTEKDKWQVVEMIERD